MQDRWNMWKRSRSRSVGQAKTRKWTPGSTYRNDPVWPSLFHRIVSSSSTATHHWEKINSLRRFAALTFDATRWGRKAFFNHILWSQSIDWLIDPLIDSSIDRLIDWLFDWLIDWPFDWLIVWLFDWSIVHLMGWLIDWSVRDILIIINE